MYFNVFDLKPGWVGIFQYTQTKFSFRRERRILIINPDDYSQRRIRTDRRFQDKRLIHFEDDPLGTPPQPVCVPLSDIHIQKDSILCDDLPERATRSFGREWQGESWRNEPQVKARATKRLREKTLRGFVIAQGQVILR